MTEITIVTAQANCYVAPEIIAIYDRYLSPDQCKAVKRIYDSDWVFVKVEPYSISGIWRPPEPERTGTKVGG